MLSTKAGQKTMFSLTMHHACIHHDMMYYNMLLETRYGASLEKARTEGIEDSKGSGFMMGFVYLVMYNMYALGMWFGSRMVRRDRTSL